MKAETLNLLATVLGADDTLPREVRERIILAAQSNPTKRRLCNVRQAAETLGVCTRSVFRLAKRGHLDVVRLSCRKLRFDADQVERLRDNGIAA